MFREAIAEFRMAVDYDPRSTQPLANLGHAYALSGKKAEARKVLAELQSLSGKAFVSPYDVATVYVALGEKEKAIDSLEKAYEVHVYPVVYINVDWRFDPLRSEPRFQELVRRIGLRPEDSPAAHAAGSVPTAPPAK
jgi:tetratricopeptide (TPR) repeat protein